MNRTGDVEKQEIGTSMGYGVEYNLNKKNDKNQIYLNNNFYILDKYLKEKMQMNCLSHPH